MWHSPVRPHRLDIGAGRLGDFYHRTGKGRAEQPLVHPIIPALESAHAIAALQKVEFKKDDVVVLTVSGRGDKDLETYLSYKDLTTL